MRTAVSRCSRRRAGLVVITIAVVGLVASCAGAPQPESAGDTTASAGDAFPVTIENCGRQITVSSPPDRVVALGNAPTATLLALGLEDRIVGITSDLPAKKVRERWREAYKSLPVIADAGYNLAREAFLAAEPDFAYATFNSPFTAKNLGTREELAARGIATYVPEFDCTDEEDRAKTSWDVIWRQITEIARLFGVPERAERVLERQRNTLAEVRRTSSGEGVTVFWWTGGTKTPWTEASGGGSPRLILEAVGASSVFSHLGGAWSHVSWEQVLAVDPDVILFTSSAKRRQEMISYLENDPVLSQLTAVQKQRYVHLPYRTIRPGVLTVYATQLLAGQLAEFEELGS